MSNELQILTKRGLERRLKRHLFGKVQSFLAITTPGFEMELASEIKTLPNLEIEEVFPGGVEFLAQFETVYDANITIRCANRVLLRIATFTARSYPELYNKAKRLNWELYCGFSDAVSFSVTSKQSRLHHTKNIESSIYDALMDYMNTFGVQVQCKDNSPICFYIRFIDDKCTVSIDSSGELLYKRGFRTSNARAPIRETIASAILLETQWHKYPCIADPLCGSGAFLLEAAMLFLNMSPGISRSFAFQKWPSFSEIHFKKSLKKVMDMVNNTTMVKIYGSDLDQSAIDAASENAKRLGVTDVIILSVVNCLHFNNNGELGRYGLIISNLPYGKRVGVECDSIEEFIRKFGRHLKSVCKGWDFAFVSAHENFEKLSGLSVNRKIRFSNGGIDVAVYIGSL